MPNTPQRPETTRPTHKRKTSSIGSIFDQNSALFKQDPEAVKAKMEGLMEFIEKDDILQTIEEFAPFKEVIAATQDTLDSMVKLHRENPAKDTKAYSFSKVDKTCYTRFGIPELMCNAVDPEPVASRVKTYLADTRTTSGDDQNPILLDVFTKFWGTYKPEVILTMEEILATTGQRTEARARLLIDICVLKTVRLLLSLKMTPLLFPELTIGISNSKESPPVQVEYGNYITLLTGRADYAMFNVIEKEGDQGTVSALKDILQKNDLKAIGAILQRISLAIRPDIDPDDQVVLLEAKKSDLENLHDLEPQAVAECVTVMQVMKRSSIGWCLTDGIQWIFGSVRVIKTPGRIYKRVYKTKPISCIEHGLVDEGALMTILMMLLVWTTVDSNKMSSFFEQQV